MEPKKLNKWQAVFTDPMTGLIDAILYADSELAASNKASSYHGLGFCYSTPVISEVKPPKPKQPPK